MFVEPAILDRDKGRRHIGGQAGDIHRRSVAAAAHAQHLSGPVDIGDLGIAPDRRQSGDFRSGDQEGGGGDGGDQEGLPLSGDAPVMDSNLAVDHGENRA